MAKKQTRRSISVSRVTYERLKSFCEANNISMSQFVEQRVGESLGDVTIIPHDRSPAGNAIGGRGPTLPAPRPVVPAAPVAPKAETRPSAPVIPMTSAAARYAVEPPPPVIKRRSDLEEQPAPKPAEKRPDQIFTF